MKKIPIQDIDEKIKIIKLQNGKEAKLFSAEYKKVNGKETIVYQYNVPCPLCNSDVIDFSYEGNFFINIQLNCRNCGIYFRPIIKR